MFDEAVSQLMIPGSVGVIPTDTVYGIVARAEDVAAVSRLYELKHRDNKPGTVIAADLEQLEKIGIKHRYLKAVEQFWPGPISVILPIANPEFEYLYQNKMSLAVRLTSNKKLLELLKQTGPLLTSSANQPGQPPANNLPEAKAYFESSVDFYIDGGDLSSRESSTIIRIVDDAIDVIREGAVKIDPSGKIVS
jgi:L-threonylcarbamoyladenylate synthase